MLAAAVADAEATPALRAHADQLSLHYWEWMPQQRAQQLDPTRDPQRLLFHTPLDLAQLPRLHSALLGAQALLAGAALDPALHTSQDPPLFGVTAAEVASQRPTLADVYARCHFGGIMPMLYAYPGDLAAYHAEIAAGASPLSVIDRRLTAPLIHDLMHGPRHRAALFPAYFDECLAGYLGVHALPSFAFPDAGEDNGILGAPWFSQVGLALVYAFGLRPMIRAHFGASPWSDAIPQTLRDALERRGWERYKACRSLHFLDDNAAPLPWVRRILWAAAHPDQPDRFDLADADLPQHPPPLPDRHGLDPWALEHALRSLYLLSTLSGGSPRVRHTLAGIDPNKAPITLDFALGVASRDALPDRFDLAPPVHWLPPSVCARWRAASLPTLTLRLRTLDALPDVIAHLLRDDPQPTAPNHPGFSLT
jgi:hypothetical protein